MSTYDSVSKALDAKFDSEDGLYGTFESIPVISQFGHNRRVELLTRLDVGDVEQMTVVDFGMGSWGVGAPYPKLQHCRRAIGMDVSASAIERSRKLVEETRPPYAEHFECYQSDGSDIPLADGTVDLFFSGESIEHVKFPPRFLSEIYRVLKADGQLVITTPNRDAVGYVERGEEYCTSAEHFWLFNYPELIEMVSEFFVVEESYGFNGSYSSYDEDCSEKDTERAADWCRQFKNEPEKATGIILRLTKKARVNFHYEINDIDSASISHAHSETLLDLNFDLQGRLMDEPQSEIVITRPASDGVVCRFWCHAWSGIVDVVDGDSRQEIDLYSEHPGWRNWMSARKTIKPTTIKIHKTSKKNAKAQADQVIFFEAFTWKRIGAQDSAITLTDAGGDTYQRGYGFSRLNMFVGTTVFHWFTETGGNLSGPWQPVGGRHTWNGSVEFWESQILEIMAANIDVIYLHLICDFEDQRINFFEAYANLRKKGWDVPKVAPFIDPNILFIQDPERFDMATGAGKDEYAAQFIRFFQQYFSKNIDEYAKEFIATVDGKPILVTWFVTGILKNVEFFTRNDLESRLSAALKDKLPTIANGIYMITTAMIDPDLPFADERMVMFCGYSYAIHTYHNGIDVWHVQAGYWDQNIRTPGYFMPRDGGKNYRRAWDAVIAAREHTNRVYVESWNEYDEGSGIHSADPSGPLRQGAAEGNVDRYSDCDDPYEYIRTTAWGAAQVNTRPQTAARVLQHQLEEKGGNEVVVTVLVRNEGNGYWEPAHKPEVTLLAPDGRAIASAPVPARLPLGIVRGEARPVSFSIPKRWLQRLPHVEVAISLGNQVIQQGYCFETQYFAGEPFAPGEDFDSRRRPDEIVNDLLFPGVTQENWQMMPWEKIALTGVLSRIRPKGAIEVGVYYGGSLSLTAPYCDEIVAIDIDPAVHDRFRKPENAEIWITPSDQGIPAAFAHFSSKGVPVNYVLIDGDHSTAGVVRDIELVLAQRPTEPMVVLMHDSGNPDTRAGILAVDWAKNPYLQFVDLDFVPGQIIEHAVVDGKGEIWGGIALALLTPTLRAGEPFIQQSARSSIRSLHYCSDKLDTI